jgi:hypothetical protein
MREPCADLDGWSLESAEERAAANPDTFEIPPPEIRKSLRPGDFAQLIFLIHFAGEEHPQGERMWVIVRKRLDGGYLGRLDNVPATVEENEEFGYGMELPFEPRHIMDARPGNARSRALAAWFPKRRWPPD